ncbi:MAG: hypothetical protein ACKVTZ_05445 [Bacteroidia bacterium]
MATWKIMCDVLIPRKGDVNVFPEMEIIEKEIHLEEDFVINIYKVASEIAKKELGNNYGYLFTSIDRTDKKTGKNYHGYIIDNETGMGGEPELEVVLDKQQRQILAGIKDAIMENCYQKSGSAEFLATNRIFHFDGIVNRIKTNVSYLSDNWSKILSHDEYASLSNFYNNITPNEISILNMKDSITVDDYDVLKTYSTSIEKK